MLSIITRYSHQFTPRQQRQTTGKKSAHMRGGERMYKQPRNERNEIARASSRSQGKKVKYALLASVVTKRCNNSY